MPDLIDPEPLPDLTTTEQLDAELQQALPGASPEVFFQLGQQAGAETLQDMLGQMVARPLTQEQREAMERWPHSVRLSRYFLLGQGNATGPFISPEGLAQIEAEQQAGIVTPTHRAPMTHVGNIEELAGVAWLPLDSFESHPLRGKLRDKRGKLPPIEIAGWNHDFNHTVQELHLMAFLSRVITLARDVPDWVTMVVFVGEPFNVDTGPILSHGRHLIPGGAEERVRYALGFTRDEVAGKPMPEWISAKGNHAKPPVTAEELKVIAEKVSGWERDPTATRTHAWKED